MRLYVDSTEGDVARVFLGEKEQIPIFLPRSWLPECASEGEWLCCIFQKDEAFTALQREKIKGIMDSLEDEP